MTAELMANRPITTQEDRIAVFHKEVREDFWYCCISREISLLGRKEVLTGKAKFGIFGDGKELPQVALARAFKKGDWRSGYYRDQTIMLALGLMKIEDFFAQLYADTKHDPFSGGRQMNAHYATATIDSNGDWLEQKNKFNIASGISCTAGQMARSVGLAQASKLYRINKDFAANSKFTDGGSEVCFCTIGDASTSEGVFFESVNAAGVLQIPLAISVWDDGYGISVPVEYQTTKGSISEVLSGFQETDEDAGIDIYKIEAWDYLDLRSKYEQGIRKVRNRQTPALFHIYGCTQQQGHSTSGSHERYKSKERLDWEKEYDCLRQFEKWILSEGIMTEEEIQATRKEAKKKVKEGRNRAWKNYSSSVSRDVVSLKGIFEEVVSSIDPKVQKELDKIKRELNKLIDPERAEIVQLARRMQYATLSYQSPALHRLRNWLHQTYREAEQDYHTHLYSESELSALKVKEVKPTYLKNSPLLNGYEIINTYFDKAFQKDKRLVAFGEDVGNIGDVNQGFAGLQAKYGEHRIFDTGIRELTIMGQAMGLAMRGFRPIAEIQYLDYLIYGLQTLVDDLSSLRYRSDGLQQAPAIIRTRGHRLEGIWHSGSPMGMIINAIRGMYLLVPRNMTQAAGFYNTMLQSNDPAIIIEVLNGYRQKEKLPNNIGEYTVPIGRPEILIEGTDVTLVTYGACIRVAQQAIKLLQTHNISVELIDVQSLLPFDIPQLIVKSLQKTNKIVFLDEDVPGGATAYMMQQVLEKQGGYRFLDENPITITSKAHRPPYGSTGDYFTKPNSEDVFEKIYQLMRKVEPKRFFAL